MNINQLYRKSTQKCKTHRYSCSFQNLQKLLGFARTTVVVLVVFACWFFGAITLIEIDMNNDFRIQSLRSFHEKAAQILQGVELYCSFLDRRNLLSKSGNKNSDQKAAALLALERARREKIVRDNVIYIPQLKQMWCLTPKAASTSWAKVIVNQLSSSSSSLFIDPNTTDSLQVILRQNFGQIDKTTFVTALGSSQIKKILLIRHPFSRLASAYKDKLADRKRKVDGMHFFQLFGAKMYRKYRTKQSRRMNKRKEPTFEEFVDFLIDTKPLDYNEHWQPISIICGLCHVHYDQIIKVEDLEELSGSHLQFLGFVNQKDVNPFPLENRGDFSNTWDYLFQNISIAKKTKLLKIYQDDFRLFGYNWTQEGKIKELINHSGAT